MADEQENSPWREPEADVLFGDVFQAPWLLDLFVRDDTSLLGGGELPAYLVPKLGKWMNAELPAEAIGLYSPRFAPKPADRFALGHASFLPDANVHTAILMSDSCLAATCLAQGRAKRSVSGRLLFAPVREVSEADWETLQDRVDFARFPLPASDGPPGPCVAELRHCFMVDAVRLAAHTDSRILACGDELAESLEAHWNAYAARRGPIAYERNTLKLAFLLAGGQQPDEEHEQVADAIAAVLDSAWVLEGRDLEAVSAAEEAVRFSDANPAELTPGLLADLSSRLRELAEFASAAADAVDSRR